LQLPEEGLYLFLLLAELMLLDLDRSHCPLRFVSLARIRKAGEDDYQDCERQTDYLRPKRDRFESASGLLSPSCCTPGSRSRHNRLPIQWGLL
jgi:hypothetical protein